MYANNFAAAILVDGKVLREFGDTVYLPFGAEYKIRLKNLNTTRAKVSIEIDGDNVSGNGIVLDPRQTTDLERFVRKGNLTTGNRFKFIERSSKVEEHRGIQVEDGIITIRYEFEIASSFTVNVTDRPVTLRDYRHWSNSSMLSSESAQGIVKSMTQYGASGSVAKGCATQDVAWTDTIATNSVANETGITVEGSISNQKFTSTHWAGSIGIPNVLNIRLLGETENNAIVRQPVTVNTKAKCKTCGTLNKATAKFCSECGTSLQIV